MRTHLTVALLAFSFIAVAAPKPLQYKTDVVVDGNFTEWAYPLPRTNKVTGINYDIANDNKNIYIFVRCTNMMTQNQIVSSGFEIWVNLKGKKKKTTGITYPLPVEKEETTTTNAAATTPPAGIPGGMGGFPGGGMEGMRGNRQTNRGGFGNFSTGNNSFVISKDLILQGFLIENGQQAARGNAVKTGITLDPDGFMLYEIAIPFNTFYKEELDADDAKMKIAIGFVVKQQKLDSNTTAMIRGMRMGGMGGFDGGGMGGFQGGGAMMMGGMNSLTQEKKFWVVATPTIK